jgi:hypothetical protein
MIIPATPPPPDEHSDWPDGVGGTHRIRPGQPQSISINLTLVAWLLHQDPAPRFQSAENDANLRTHNRVRLAYRNPSDAGRAVVHWLNGYFVDETQMPPVTTGFVTACGHIISLGDGVRTGQAVSCLSRECAFMAQKHERPATVVTPSGPCHGGAAKKTARRDATGNSVTIRPAEDSFRSVKSAAVNRVNGQPRSQVATAGGLINHLRTTSSGRASGPSKGEPRVLESVAPVRLKAGPTSPVQSGMT